MPQLSLEQVKTRFEAAQLAGFIYQHDSHILVLQEPLTEQGTVLNNFIQHEHSTDQLGLQFAIRVQQDSAQFLIGLTHSNQDRRYEIGAGHLKGEQRAFNLLYAFYNYPKGFYMLEAPLYSTSAQLEQAIEQQLFGQQHLAFLDTAIKVNPMGQQVHWMKHFIVQQALDMKVRMQTALL